MTRRKQGEGVNLGHTWRPRSDANLPNQLIPPPHFLDAPTRFAGRVAAGALSREKQTKESKKKKNKKPTAVKNASVNITVNIDLDTNTTCMAWAWPRATNTQEYTCTCTDMNPTHS